MHCSLILTAPKIFTASKFHNFLTVQKFPIKLRAQAKTCVLRQSRPTLPKPTVPTSGGANCSMLNALMLTCKFHYFHELLKDHGVLQHYLMSPESVMSPEILTEPKNPK